MRRFGRILACLTWLLAAAGVSYGQAASQPADVLAPLPPSTAARPAATSQPGLPAGSQGSSTGSYVPYSLRHRYPYNLLPAQPKGPVDLNAKGAREFAPPSLITGSYVNAAKGTAVGNAQTTYRADANANAGMVTNTYTLTGVNPADALPAKMPFWAPSMDPYRSYYSRSLYFGTPRGSAFFGQFNTGQTPAQTIFTPSAAYSYRSPVGQYFEQQRLTPFNTGATGWAFGSREFLPPSAFTQSQQSSAPFGSTGRLSSGGLRP